MVRLLLLCEAALPSLTTMVSIPQWCDCCPRLNRPATVKTVVSIPQWCDCCKLDHRFAFWLRMCFNPTMVRLLLHSRSLDSVAAHLFQSHNGAIAAQVHSANERQIPLVSIPQWCDCCSSFSFLLSRSFPRFNPTMVRLLPRQNLGFWGQNEAK